MIEKEGGAYLGVLEGNLYTLEENGSLDETNSYASRGRESIAMGRFSFLSRPFHRNSAHEAGSNAYLVIAGSRTTTTRRRLASRRKIEEFRNAFKMLKRSAIRRDERRRARLSSRRTSSYARIGRPVGSAELRSPRPQCSSWSKQDVTVAGRPAGA